MNLPVGYAVITVTDHLQPVQSILKILTSHTVPTGYARSTEVYAVAATPTTTESTLTPGVRELSYQGQGPGNILIGNDSNVTTSHFRSKFGAGDSDRWRNTQNDISLAMEYIAADTDNAAISIGWMKA